MIFMVKGDAETCDDEQEGGSATRLFSRKVSPVVLLSKCPGEILSFRVGRISGKGVFYPEP